MDKNLEKYGLNKIDNSEYATQRSVKNKRRMYLREQIKIFSEEIDAIDEEQRNTFNISLELGIDLTSSYDINELKIGDKILFYSLSGGYYGLFEGIYERYEGYASVKDIKLVYHPKNVDGCSHRVGFNEIIKILKE